MGRVETDEQLWALVVRGDGVAFARIFDRHGDRVFRHAWRLMVQRQDAEDVVSAAFLELWRKRGGVRMVDGSVLPWLLATATNCALNARRSQRRHRRLVAHIPLPPDALDAETEAIERGLTIGEGSALAVAMRSLSDKDARLVALVVLEDIPLAEAADAVGISYGAAKTRLSRAKARLRETLGEREPAPEGVRA